MKLIERIFPAEKTRRPPTRTICGALTILAALSGAGAASAAPCTNMLTPSNATPTGYGAAYNVLTAAKEFLIQGTECADSLARVSVGSGSADQYVYKNALYWTGSAWQELPLSGSTLVSDTWFRGAATASLPLGETPRYVLGYVCQRDDGKWKCGCSDQECDDERWQMQALADVVIRPTEPGTCMAPPTLSNPMVVQDTCPGAIDARGGDLLVRMPNRTCTGQLSITNARNVHVVGGRIELGTNVPRAVSLASIRGHVHLEGMYIDAMNRYADGISIFNSPGATFTVQNSLIKGPGGIPAGTHGDVAHTQGGGPLKEFRVENVSGFTSYQGIFTPFRTPQDGSTGARRIVMKNLHLAYDPRMPEAQKPLMLLTLGSGTPSPTIYGQLDYSPPDGTTLSNVFIDTSLRNVAYYTKVSVQPRPGADGCATFDPVHKIEGKVCGGEPTRGTFAPESAVGLNYARSKFCS